MVNLWKKFQLINWKTWRLQLNDKMQMTIQILVPLLLSLFLILHRLNCEVISEEGFVDIGWMYPRFHWGHLQKYSIGKNFDVYYYPNCKCLDRVMKTATEWIEELAKPQFESGRFVFKAVENVADLERLNEIEDPLGAVQFGEQFVNADICPKNISYTLRYPHDLRIQVNGTDHWNTNKLYPTPDLFMNIPSYYSPPGAKDRSFYYDTQPSHYMETAFGVQYGIMYGYTAELIGGQENRMTKRYLAKFWYPKYVDDKIITALDLIISVIVLLCFLYPVSLTAKHMSLEKERQLMKVLNVPYCLNMIAWFIKTCVVTLIIAIFIVAVLKVRWSNKSYAVLTYTNWKILLLFLCNYALSVVTFCFMTVSLFSNASAITILATLFWFFTYMPYMTTLIAYNDLTLIIKLALSIFPNTAMGFGFIIIRKFEELEVGLQWEHLYRPINVDDEIVFAHILIMMLIDSALFMIITIYMEVVYPKRKFSLFRKKLPISQNYPKYIVKDRKPAVVVDSNINSDVGKTKEIIVIIKDLRKQYNGMYIINGLSVSLYEGEITVLYGASRSGKSTVLSILAGLITSSGGTTTINGYNIAKEKKKARNSVGFSLQRNLFFDNLTIREHIVLYCHLRSMKTYQIDDEVQKYSNLLELEHEINIMSKNLTDIMKCRLSIAMALCGECKVVLLDELTTGMDRLTQRLFWNILEVEKKNRTILLTTHCKDDINDLVDRVVIINNNNEIKDKNAETTENAENSEHANNENDDFMNKSCSDGYRLICVKNSCCLTDKVTLFLRRYMPDIVVENDIDSQITYHLSNQYLNKLGKMLVQLEEKSEKLYIESFSVLNDEMSKLSHSGKETQNEVKVSITEKRILNQWKAMFFKKYLYVINNYILFSIIILMPTLFARFSISIHESLGVYKSLKPITYSIDQFPQTVSFIGRDAYDGGDFEKEMKMGYEKHINSFGSNHTCINVSSAQEFTLEMRRNTTIFEFDRKYIFGVGLGLSGLKIMVAYFNAQLLHSLPIAYNLVYNAFIRMATKDPSVNLTVTMHPFPSKPSTVLAWNKTKLGFILAMNLSLCMSVVTAFYVVFIIKERVNQAKHLQYGNGVQVVKFWLSHFSFDCGIYLIAIITMFSMIAYSQEDGLYKVIELGRLLLVLMLFAFLSIIITYIWGCCCDDAVTAFIWLAMFNILTVFGLFWHYYLRIFKPALSSKLFSNLHLIFLIFPHYSLGVTLENVCIISILTSNCLKLCKYKYVQEYTGNDCTMDSLGKLYHECSVPGYLDWKEPGILMHLAYAFTELAVALLILFILESRLINISLFHKILGKKLDNKLDENPLDICICAQTMDRNVKIERLKILKMSPSDVKETNLVFNQMTKYYGKILAVNKISTTVKSSECLGILGSQGSGKTTILKMLMGLEQISFGDAYVKGVSVKDKIKDVYPHIGYCPQLESLIPNLTVRDHLRIFSILRGQRQMENIKSICKDFGFIKCIDKPVETLSVTDKRKLNVAIAFIGNPSVIYLDEPTKCMHPDDKVQLWDKINQIRQTGTSIVLATTSAEECEALCTNIAILVNGEFQFLESTGDLKNKIPNIIRLKITIKTNEVNHAGERHNKNDKTKKPLQYNKFKYESTDEGNKSDLCEAKTKITQFVKDNRSVKKKIIQFVKAEIGNADVEKQKERKDSLSFKMRMDDQNQYTKLFSKLEENKKKLKIECFTIHRWALNDFFLNLTEPRIE